MELDRSATRDYVIRREGEALLAADLKDEMQLNPECANDILVVAAHPTESEFGDVFLDTYTADGAAEVRSQLA